MLTLRDTDEKDLERSNYGSHGAPLKVSAIPSFNIFALLHAASLWPCSIIRVALDLDQDIPAVFCCAREFESVILNLIINAKDAMPTGGAIRIQAYRGDFGEGATVVVRVTDTGCGMSADTARRAFQPLFTTKPPGRGTGLGLAMVSDFARRAGGSVQIESAANCGTSVILRLPACRN